MFRAIAEITGNSPLIQSQNPLNDFLNEIQVNYPNVNFENQIVQHKTIQGYTNLILT